MSTIYISKAHQDLAERLARTPTNMAKRPIFRTHMQLLAFAAMVGYSKDKSVNLEHTDRGIEIYESVFDNANLLGLPYLMALDQFRDGDILRDTRDKECWSVIESYAEAGFQVIHQWLLDQPGDVDGVETILSKMAEEASERIRESTDSLNPDVQF